MRLKLGDLVCLDRGMLQRSIIVNNDFAKLAGPPQSSSNLDVFPLQPRPLVDVKIGSPGLLMRVVELHPGAQICDLQVLIDGHIVQSPAYHWKRLE